AARVRSQAGRSWLSGVQWAMPKAQCGRRVGRLRFQLFRQRTGRNLTEAPLQPPLCAKTEDQVDSEAEQEPTRDQNRPASTRNAFPGLRDKDQQKRAQPVRQQYTA